MDGAGDGSDQGQGLIRGGCYVIVTWLTARWISC